MTLSGPAKRPTVFLGESEQFHHKPLYVEIVHRAHATGLAGASVFRGIEGFRASQHVHTTRLLSLSEGLVVIDDVTVVRYVGRQPPSTTQEPS